MTEAMTWSVMKWLREKKRVRKTADEANAALDRMRQSIQQRWPTRFRTCYAAFAARSEGTTSARSRLDPSSTASDQQTMLIVEKVKQSDDEAYRARMDAEETFDKAEKLLRTSLAREGCRKAIHSWELHEKAICKAEAVTALK